mmetsp:Transcript_64963/g.89235  ORF Transcript_64963/g.89235 Transcript_64963/m.89235 type:complete len:470 (-) Transcript_64963:328-1737(-)|eukprot:CAMPEP_0185748228 /NCGR_PEP_ID=MMETSP1174-20130828/6896_1 /TAXON_ID=35687 /ORGANISM="Dictyocha speculum, Strain CCMP1381" /LENGTH=469 /DNA_ID=CAMNT_0028423777 /DNA_START=139 /DNA_END=1548 /DNA_ORIENTATION=-
MPLMGGIRIIFLMLIQLGETDSFCFQPSHVFKSFKAPASLTKRRAWSPLWSTTQRRITIQYVIRSSQLRSQSGGDDDGREGGDEENEISSSDLARLDTSRLFADLKQRQSQIARGGGGDAGAIVQLLTMQSPGDLIGEFMMTSSPMVVDAMREAITGLLGGLPREYLVDYTTTTEKLKSLATMLQMTGYMFRNGEYILALQKLLNVNAKSPAEMQAAFERIDINNDGYIDRGEVEQLFRSFYDGEDPPAYEVQTFMKFFDVNSDNKITWDEFSKGLGLDKVAKPTMDLQRFEEATGDDPLMLNPSSEVDELARNVKGTVTIQSETGQTLEVEASIYMDSLRKEAEALRAAIEVTSGRASSSSSSSQEIMAAGDGAMQPDTSSLAAYIKDLPPKKRDALIAGIEPKTLEAMKRLVNWVVGEKDVVGVPDKNGKLSLDRNSLASLCLWQLVLGYKLREAEATGEAKMLKGR